MADDHSRAPRTASALGFAGLLPQLIAIALIFAGGRELRNAAALVGLAYSGIILSFLGGLWWGLAARAPWPVPTWMWIASVVPSLYALAVAIALVSGICSTGFALVAMGLGLIATPVADGRLKTADLTPTWWMRLRVPLWCGLGALTMIGAFG